MRENGLFFKNTEIGFVNQFYDPLAHSNSRKVVFQCNENVVQGLGAIFVLKV